VDLRSEYWYAKNPIVGPGHTVTLTLSTAYSAVISVFVIKGSNPTTPIDGASAIGDEGGVQSTTVTSPTITTAVANDLVICWEKSANAETSIPGSGYTKDSQSSNYLASEYQSVVTAGPHTGTWTISPAGSWQSAVIAVRP
jgi:hypothetical protein